MHFLSTRFRVLLLNSICWLRLIFPPNKWLSTLIDLFGFYWILEYSGHILWPQSFLPSCSCWTLFPGPKWTLLLFSVFCPGLPSTWGYPCGLLGPVGGSNSRFLLLPVWILLMQPCQLALSQTMAALPAHFYLWFSYSILVYIFLCKI